MTELDVSSRISKIEDEIRNLKKIMRSKERFLSSAGKWSDIDTEKLKKDIYDARSMSSRRRAVF